MSGRKRNRKTRRGCRGQGSQENSDKSFRERLISAHTESGCPSCGNQELDHELHCDECGWNPDEITTPDQ